MKNKYPKCNYKLCVEIQHFLTLFFLIEIIGGARVRKESSEIGRDLFSCYEMWPPLSFYALISIDLLHDC